MRVLIVDDDEIALELLEHTLQQAGHDVVRASNGREALDQIRTGQFRMLISDWEMPEMDGIELCKRVRERHYGGYVYVILVTSNDGCDNVVAGLNAGADDFLSKPFQPAELCVRLRAGERLLSLESRNMMIFALAKLAESRDPETGAHLERMREYCKLIAESLSRKPEHEHIVDGEYVQSIYLTSPLHDIGKVGIPDSVLLKPGRLTPEEFDVMKTHTTIGAETLSAAMEQNPDADFLRMARDIALTHHEKVDGSGYPNGLSERSIPLCGRIVALADVYDALRAKRVYKEAFTHEVARNIILEGCGSHFDPAIVECFLERESEFIEIHDCFQDEDEQADEFATVGSGAEMAGLFA